MTPPLPETSTVRLLSFNESGKFYILSDGKHRFFADARHFPNGLSTGALVTFTIQATQKGKLATDIRLLAEDRLAELERIRRETL